MRTSRVVKSVGQFVVRTELRAVRWHSVCSNECWRHVSWSAQCTRWTVLDGVHTRYVQLTPLSLSTLDTFLADRTIGGAFGTLCRLSVVCDVLYSGETARLSWKLSERVNRKPGQKVDFFWSLLYFYFRLRLYGHRDGRFCLILPVQPSDRY